MHPVVVAAGRLAEAGLALLGSRPTGHSPFVTREELKALADIGAEHGVVDADEGRMIRSVLELHERPVAAVMVPLVDMASLDAAASVAALEALAGETGFARFPVHEGRVDNVVGIVSLADVLQAGAPDDPAAAPIAPFVRRGVTYVPETKSVGDLLRELRYSDMPMAIVVDEHGGVTGLATAEDLVAEIIGRIRDERHDDHGAVAADDGAVVECDGRMDIEELLDLTGLELDHRGFETVAGLVIQLTGRIPEAGETLDLGAWRVEVLEATPRRVERLRFTRK
jgi:CBS domain containing-hemolysin-like protein